MKGRIHSFMSLGGADGPGLRFVVFTQGCPLRCVCCHNPDTWDAFAGQEYEPEEVARRALRCKPYFEEDGGVTLSGGEPLFQAEFAARLFRMLHEMGIRTALDTAGAVKSAFTGEVLENTDLVICDIKFPDEERYARYTGGSLKTVLGFLNLTERMGVPLWVRHVVIPGLTDSTENVRAVAALAENFGNLKKIELLPFKNICAPKYEALNIDFPLKDTPACDGETLKRLQALC